jgi:ATP synthase protein I
MSENRDGPGRSSGGNSFEERLRAARAREGLDKQPPVPPASGSGRFGTSPIGIAFRVGAELLSALVVAVAIGWGLDSWLHTRPLFIAIFVLLGGAAGVLNVWRVFAPKPTASGTRHDGW